jgi:hypothetical protein
MNRIYLIAFTILLFTNNLIGQNINEYVGSNFKLGINVGPNHNSLRGDELAEGYEPNINLFTGLSFEFKVNEKFSILTNINYEVKSVKTEYTTTIGFWTNYQKIEIEDKTKFQYLNIPILARIYFGFENEFFVNGGFFYNHLFDVNNKMINKENGEDLSELDFNELFNQNDIGISLGIGVNFKINNQNSMAIELRDDLGISNIGNRDFGSISPTSTNTIKFIVNWSFEL